MASSNSVGDLYAAVGKLAYTESIMAGAPLLPFAPGDSDALESQSKVLTNEALSLRALDPSRLIQQKVDGAVAHVQAAQSLFDLINSSPTNSLDKLTVLSTVTAAINAVTVAETPPAAAAPSMAA